MRIGRRAVGDAMRQVARELDRPDVVVAGTLQEHDDRLLVGAQLRRRDEIGLRLADRAHDVALPIDPHQPDCRIV
jgi:hypothetical protein